MPLIQRRFLAITTVLSIVLATVAVLAPQMAKPADAAARTKFTICHRTNAITNPYRRITVAWSSVNEDGGGHDNVSHDGPVFNVSNPAASHGTLPRDSGLGTEASGSNNRWGDIFLAEKNAGQWNAKNWFVNDANKNSGANVAGQAIFNGATFTYNGVTKQACRTMTAQEHLASEIPALLEIEAAKPVNERRTDRQVIAEGMASLDEMGAAEDVILKEQLGGSFTTWYNNCTSNCTDVNALTTSIDALPQPSVTTSSPTITSSTAATLNGTISPLGKSMQWYFEFATTNDFSDSNLAIVNHPSTPQGPSTSSSTVAVNTPVTGLTAGTTYYYRTVGLIATGTAGTDSYLESFYYGSVESFRTSNPSVTTESATSVTGSTATINGTGTSNGAASTVTFTWGTRSDLTGGDTQTGVAATPDPLASSASGTAVSANLTGLVAGTTYYFRATITNTNGTAVGSILQFTTVGPPSVTTVAASLVTNSSATINGTGTSAGATSTVTFTWGTSATLDPNDANTRTGVVPTPSSLGASAANSAFSANLTGLTGGTTYYFRATITNANSNGNIDGSILQFTTPNLPSVTTEPATSVLETTATINGTGTSNGAQSNVTFTWGTRSDLTGGDTQSGVAASPDPLASSASGAAVSANLTGLTGSTTYYFRATITNTNGTVVGSILQFTTAAPMNVNNSTPPAVTTEPATSVTGTTATINGTGTSNGAASTVTFTWGLSPTLATGNNTVTASPDPLASSASGTAVSANLTGLTAGTTYYFRATITNTNGTADGIIREFTTPLPSNSNSNPLGRVIGTAWFDIDRDNVRDPGEPLLPGVDVQMTPVGVTGQSAGTVRKKNFIVKTDPAGSFDFSDLPPGTYSIKSVLPGEFGIQESWDSSGDNDWSVTVTVVARQTARGDFAAVGTAQATGSVEGGGGGTVDATWSGFDQTNETNDDVTFTVKVAGSGNFSLDGLPTGKYTVKATSRTGRTLVSTNALRITSKGATLTLNGLTMNVSVVSMLPQTGATTSLLPFGFATMLIPAGVALTATMRRRRRI